MGQRVRNAQPEGFLSGLGTSPARAHMLLGRLEAAGRVTAREHDGRPFYTARQGKNVN